MPSKPGAAVAAEGMCSSRFWPLSLEPGQNQFRVIVTAPPAMAPVVSWIEMNLSQQPPFSSGVMVREDLLVP